MRIILALLLLATGQMARADQQTEFCYGFSQGYQAVHGNVMVPMCPIATFPPVGTSYFQQGLRTGMSR